MPSRPSRGGVRGGARGGAVAPWDHFASPWTWEGVAALQCGDPFLERMAVRKAARENLGGGRWRAAALPSADPERLEADLLGTDLFEPRRPRLLMEAHGAGKAVRDVVLASLGALGAARALVLFGRDGDFLKALRRSPGVAFRRIAAPAFWQRERLFDFLRAGMGVRLDAGARAHLLDASDGSTRGIVGVLRTVRDNVPDGAPVSSEDARRLVPPARLDVFKLAALYGNRRFGPFYGELLKGEFSFDDYRGAMGFMQAHLTRLHDPERRAAGKARPSSYDRGLVEQGRGWPDKDELMEHVGRFGEWEVMAKRKDGFLRQELRCRWLRHRGTP